MISCFWKYRPDGGDRHIQSTAVKTSNPTYLQKCHSVITSLALMTPAAKVFSKFHITKYLTSYSYKIKIYRCYIKINRPHNQLRPNAFFNFYPFVSHVCRILERKRILEIYQSSLHYSQP